MVETYSQVALDDLKGTGEDPCLVVLCPTADLAVQVFNTNSDREVFSIATVPTLIEQGITKYKVRISFVTSYASYSKMREDICRAPAGALQISIGKD